MIKWIRTRFLRRRLLLPVSLIGAVILSAISISSAQAGAIGCRTDPIVTLSNGDVVTILLDIDADASQVTSIDYTLHVPPDITATNITYTGAALGLAENLTVIPDTKDKYRSEIVVAAPKSVVVVATMTFEDAVVTVTGSGGKVIKATIEFDTPDD